MEEMLAEVAASREVRLSGGDAGGREERRRAVAERLAPVMNRVVRVTSKDGRVFTGRFRCVDDTCGIVLAGAFLVGPPSLVAGDKVQLGAWILPDEHIERIEVAREPA